jgi:hypothetical protein
MRYPRILIAAFLLSLLPHVAAAGPVTLRAFGFITDKYDYEQEPDVVSDPILDAVPLGSPWELVVRYDPAAAGTPTFDESVPAFRYDNAILDARLSVNGFEYAQSGGDIYTNTSLLAYEPGFGGWGLVQFVWFEGGWSIPVGGPNLNVNFGLTMFSYLDAAALDGALPANPVASPIQDGFRGFEWMTFGSWENTRAAGMSSPDVNVEQLSEVPEPATLALLGVGVAMLVVRRQSAKRRRG